MMHDNHDSWLGTDDLDMMLPTSGRHRFDRSIDRKMAVRRIGRNICFGKGGGGSAPSPDPMIGVAAMKNAEIGGEWLNFARDQFDSGNERLKVTDALTNRVIEQQMAGQDRQNAIQDETMAWARVDRERVKNVFQPL